MQGTTKGKIKFIGFVSTGLLLYFGIKYFFGAYPAPPINDSVAAMQEYVQNRFYVIISVNVFMLFVYIIVSNFLYRYGKLIKGNMQYPPPDTDLPFSKKIVRGQKALDSANLCFIASGLIVIQGIIKLGIIVYASMI
tara:strand:+ start:3508 stop:3918 length:411 start_codon:yes stop_codon:yes gene_type:complete